MSVIKPIEEKCASLMCSGQVIVSLASAAKELIENSIDAGATRVELNLLDHGVESIEVVDDGAGISAEDFECFALKSCTSKLRSFSDLQGVTSFGFRGEAINSLCEVSESFSVITKTSKDPEGFKISYDRFGKLLSVEKCHRTIGTTIKIRNIFSPLPVRRKDMIKNIKKHYSRLISMVNSYAIISIGVRLTVTNTGSNNKKVVVLSTQKGSSVEDNISNIYGSKFSADLIPINVALPRFGSPTPTAEETNSKLTGMISKAGVGIGRSDASRQLLYVNGRPVELKKISRICNEVWRQFEMKNKPAFVLNLCLPPQSFDVNVTPDKREVFIENEEAIVEALKAHLNVIWSPAESCYSVNHAQHQSRLTDFIQDEGSSYLNVCADDASCQPAATTLKGTVGMDESRVGSCGDDYVADGHRTEGTQRQQTRAAESVSTLPDRAEDSELLQDKLSCEGMYNARELLADWESGQPTKVEEKVWEFEPEEILRSFQKKRRRDGNSQRIGLALSPEAGADEIDCEKATLALSRVLHREDFNKMKVIGQFNLGFVLAQLNTDIFILDQHACDEKKNYERICRTLVLNVQPLVSPRTIECGGNQEATIVENIRLFEKNGLIIEVDTNGPPGKKAKLMGVGCTKGLQLNVADVLELASILSDRHCSTDDVVLPKIKAACAMRACRSSIMIGTALDMQQMKKLVEGLSEVEHPWNCPHGRPTMRHLLDLSTLYDDDKNEWN